MRFDSQLTHSFKHQAWILALVLIALPLSTGCQISSGINRFNPFYNPKLTSYITPSQRIEAAELIAKEADGTDSESQTEQVRTLANKLTSEPDPLVREALLKACAKYNVDLARKALIAGLNDENLYVRTTCCRELGRLGVSEAANDLSRVAMEDKDFDVRVAAARALGKTGNQEEARKGLLTVLEDRNPAMQLAGVEAMRDLTGQNLGYNVAAYVALAKGDSASATRLAENTQPKTKYLEETIPLIK